LKVKKSNAWFAAVGNHSFGTKGYNSNPETMPTQRREEIYFSVLMSRFGVSPGFAMTKPRLTPNGTYFTSNHKN